MKSAYLFLVTVAVVVTCKPQRSNNDIIWYPVDEEDGVFISTFGEKHRSSQTARWRSHRRARFSGMEQPRNFPAFSYEDPTENEDPSFFHNIHERRAQQNGPFFQRAPLPFQNQQFPVKRPNNPFLSGVNKRPQTQGQQNLNDNDIQDIINEIFDVNKHPPVSEFPGMKPETGSTEQWGSGSSQRPINNQWGNQRPGSTNQWGSSLPQRPATGGTNQWGGNSGSSFPQRPTNNRPNRPTQVNNQWGSQKPETTNQWGSTTSQRPNNQWGGNTGSHFPQTTDSEWINRPNRPTKKPDNESDKLVFPGEIQTTTSTEVLPTEAPTMSPCERKCPVTPEFNPVCGSDMVTYSNAGRLKCAQLCGKEVALAHHGNCGRTRLVTPLLSVNDNQGRFGFW